ncbi:hypothetical protein, partial [Parvimonas sp. D9]
QVRPKGSIESVEEFMQHYKVGNTLYGVMALGGMSSVEKYHIKKVRPIEGTIVYYGIYDSYIFSLLDKNVIEVNEYNDHFLFANEAYALAYHQYCIDHNIDFRSKWA